MPLDPPWVAIAAIDELAPAQMKKVQVAGKRLLLANAEGKYYVVDEMCSHEDYSLYLGCIKDHRIKCSLHGSFFDLRTGEPLVEPACEPIRTYPVRLAEEQIWVDPT
jgi:3-phenylpropionate/trans-cinnamate dioxygenase ferredoxin subunit